MIELGRRLRRWRLERFAAICLEGLFFLLPALAAYLLAVLALDRWLSLPAAARWTLFSLGAAGSLAGAYARLFQPLELLRSSRVLRDAAARYPEISAYLIPAWELSRHRTPANVSREMVDEHLRRTEALVRRLPPGSAFPWRPARRAVRWAALVALLWGISTPWLHGGSASLGRVLAPWRDVSLDREVAVEPGDLRTRWALPVEIRARWRSPRADSSLTLWARSGDSDFSRVPWDREEAGGAAFRLAALTSTLEYRVGSRDMRTRVYRLTPLPVAHLRDVLVSVRLPGREGGAREQKLADQGEIAALRGSWVTLRGKPDQPLESARMRLSFLGSPVEMKPLPSGEWEGGFPLNEDGTLRIELVSAEGIRDPEPASVPLRTLEDRPPSVDLLAPGFELEVSPREKLPLTYSARDDYGLSQVSLVFRAGGAERETVLRRFPGHPMEQLGEESWDLSGLPAGGQVEFWLKAYDDRRPAPQSGLSARGVLRLVDFEGAHAGVERRWLGAEEALSRLAADERGMLKVLAAASTASVRAEDLQAVRSADEALAGKWDRTIQDVESLSSAMEDDPYANPGMAEMTRALGQTLKGLQGSELAGAREAARNGDWSRASEGHERLEGRLRKAADLLAAGREMQRMQDFWSEANRMDEAGAEVRDSLEAAAKAGRAPSPEERREIDKALAELRGQMDAMSQAIQSLPKADPGGLRDRNRKVYSVPLDAAQRTLGALEAALARGDYREAARIAAELSRQLSRVRQALSQAAGSQASEQEASSRRLEELLRYWEEVVGQQTQSLEVTAAIEDEKVKSRLEAQAELLRRLAAEQEKVVGESAALGRPMPPEALAAMRRVLKEFQDGRVQESPALLGMIVQRLAAELLRYPPLKDGIPSPGKEISGLAEREEALRRRLEAGAPEPRFSEARLSDLFAAGAVQKQVRRKTAELERRLEEAAKEGGLLPPDAIPSVRGAQAEQEAAEASLAAGESGSAKGHQEKALEHLDRGQKSCSDALQRQQSMQQSSLTPFSKPRSFVRPAGRGQTGADTSFVPLPGAQDYQPPKEIREEVEKSLRERRPKAFDGAVDEYLRRMSQ